MLILCVGLMAAGCASPRPEASVDVMFRQTGAVSPGVLELTTPALVSDIHGTYSIERAGFYSRSSLDERGRVVRGSNAVLVLEFVDHGATSLLRTDSKRVSLRAEFGPDGKVVAGLLGSPDGAVASGFTAAGNDPFEAGTWEILYDGPDWVVGRLDIEFQKYRAAGNFRVPRLR
jgi:hypothetical protein